MKRFYLWVTVTALFGAMGCGDELVEQDYYGEPLLSVQGALNIVPTDRPNHTLQLMLFWNKAGASGKMFVDDLQIEGGGIGHYQLDVFSPPPSEALFTDVNTGEMWSFAQILAADDLYGEGPLDTADMSWENLPSLLPRWRGGSEAVMIGYAPHGLSGNACLSQRVGGPIPAGYFLFELSGDCFCYGPVNGTIFDCLSEGDCQAYQLRVIPLDSKVDLNIVDDIATFKAIHPKIVLEDFCLG